MKSLVAEQVVTQREEISKLQETVQQLTRVLEAQSNFKKGLGQGSGSSGKRSGGRSRSGPRSGEGKR